MGLVQDNNSIKNFQNLQAVLVAGTVTITGIYLSRNRWVGVTRIAAGGTLGELRHDRAADVFGNGTGSVTIVSSNALDTSTVQVLILCDLQGLG